MRGSLLKRGETWSYVLYLGRGSDGKKQQKRVGGFRTRRESEAALTEALERVRTGTWADPGRQTVGEYLEDWLTAVAPACGRRRRRVTSTPFGSGSSPGSAICASGA